MTQAGHLARLGDALLGSRRVLTALTATAVLCLFANSALAAKERFVRNKPHVNVGTIGMNNETLTLRLELVDTVERATGMPTGTPCNGTVDMRIEDAATKA